MAPETKPTTETTMIPTDATPRSLPALARRATSYEVVGEGPDGARFVVGYAVRTTRLGLVAVLQARADDLLPLIPDTAAAKFSRSHGRWSVTMGPWTFRVTGRTERDARCAINMGATS